MNILAYLSQGFDITTSKYVATVVINGRLTTGSSDTDITPDEIGSLVAAALKDMKAHDNG